MTAIRLAQDPELIDSARSPRESPFASPRESPRAGAARSVTHALLLFLSPLSDTS
jgi:hypothetical protein